MEVLKRSAAQIAAIFRGLPPAQRALAIAVAIAAIAGAFALAAYARSKDYATLYTGLSEEDGARVVEKLRSLQVPFRLSSDGRTVSVPWDRVAELRLDLAAEGVFKSGGGFEILDRGAFGLSDFGEQVLYTRALAAELGRTIGELEPVDRAFVHLARPKSSVFLGSERPATASVVVRLKPGRSLSARQVAGIRELVAGSVEGLDLSRVSILDANGAILAGAGAAISNGTGGDGEEGAFFSAPVFEREKAVEEHLAKKAQTLLDSALGPGRAIVRVSARLGREKVEETRERYDPQGVARTETVSSRLTSSKSGGKPVPAGVSGNTPGGVQAPTDSEDTKETEETTTTQYEIGRTTQRISKDPGAIERLSVGLLLDEALDAKAERVESIVKEAVGFDPKRGDTFSRQSVPFSQPMLADARRAFEEEDRRERRIEIVRHGVLAAAVLFAAAIGFLALRRPSPAEAREAPKRASAPSAPTFSPSMAGAERPPEKRRLRDEVARELEEDPEGAAWVLASWLDEGAAKRNQENGNGAIPGRSR